VKLSAPPPPPPEPPQPGDPPGDEAPREPDPAAAAATPTPPPEPAPEPPPAPAARPATWPLWHAGADTTIVVLTVGLAFLVASFAARNSDLWLHLGAGKLLTTGEYRLGSDPFSFTAADRAWVNHSWLFDLAAYLLYSGDGFALVVTKALAVAAAVAVLLAIRRPGHSLWAWAAVAVVAVLAAAPRLVLAPLVGSVFFLAVTLFLVFRVPNPPGSWRLPIAIGVTFWFWANTDAWFFLGPLVLAALLVGELVRTKGLNAEGAATPEDDPLGQLPDLTTLARALGVGVVACMLNPHHVRVWELPFELTGGAGAEDPRLAPLLYSPLTSLYWGSAGLGNNLNGYAFLALLVGGLYAVALTAIVGRFAERPFDIEPLPLPHAVLWCVFAGLALKTVYAVPFLAVVSVPLLAGRLNAISARVVLGSVNDTRTRLVLTLSTLGRVVSVIGLVALGACAWPGWLAQVTTNPAFARRVAWEVAPDPALARAAATFGAWRAAGRLGPDDRGFVGSLDLANYLAWHAPGEKVFANARYAHHRAEWPDFLKARRGLGAVAAADAPPDLRDAAGVFDRHRLTYAAVAVAAADQGPTRAQVKEAMLRMWANPNRWAAWYLDGRTAVSGYRAGEAATPPTFEPLRVDPVVLAFGPTAEKLKDGPIDPPPPPRTWVDDFTRPVQPVSPGVDEAVAWIEYRERTIEARYATNLLVASSLLRVVPTPGAVSLPGAAAHVWYENQAMGGNLTFTPPADGSFSAIPILVLKAARRAVAENPDHPDGYWALARAYDAPGSPLPAGERAVGQLTALRQALDRFPPPDDLPRGVYSASPFQVAGLLANLYLGRQQQGLGFPGTRVDLPGVSELAGDLIVTDGKNVGRVPAGIPRPPALQVIDGPYHLALDVAHQTAKQSLDYAQRELAPRAGETKDQKDQRERILKSLKDQTDKLDGQVRGAIEKYRNAAPGQPKARDRFELLLRLNLTGKAIEAVHGRPTDDLQKEFGGPLEAAVVLLKVIALELAVGRVEDAAADAVATRAYFDQLVEQKTAVQEIAQLAAGPLRVLQQQILLLTGQHQAAGQELEATEGGAVARADPLPPAEVLPPTWPPVPAVPSLNTTIGLQFYYQHRQAMFAQARQGVIAQRDREAVFFFRRGLLALLEGDVDGARARFEAARRPPLPAWDVPDMVVPAAPVYLRLIQDAARRGAGR
jgi:hypothetical protein